MKIGIIAALPEEVSALKAALENAQEVSLGGTIYHTGSIGGSSVVLMQCGMGKVSAAAGTQAMITAFSPDTIINTGCAGALAAELKVGDFVVSSATVEWDLDTIAIGNPRGYVSSMNAVRMPADSQLAEMIRAALPQDASVLTGLVVSGDQFVSTEAQRKLILESFPDALCAEMEGGAIGHVCRQNNVPFCVLRCMSDTADGNSGISFAEFAPVAGEKSARALLSLLTKGV